MGVSYTGLGYSLAFIINFKLLPFLRCCKAAVLILLLILLLFIIQLTPIVLGH